MLYGHIVFPDEACAILKEYSRNHSENAVHIIFVHALTTDVAFYILSNAVCGVISEESSFATHGANILRCYYNKSRKKLAWVSGIKHSDIENLFGEKIFITSDGEIGVFSSAEYTYFNNKEIRINKNVSYYPLNKRSILDYNISNDSYNICYWPHRKFDLLTFSIMQKGLEKNLSLFGIDTPFIFMDDYGNIWFRNAPLISRLSELAKDCDYALPMLLKQINLYTDIYIRLQSKFCFSDLTKMLIDYFSIFILFHDTYEDVLVDADLFFKRNLNELVSYQLMNMLMSCKLDEWMLNNNILLEKRKSLLSTEKLAPLPGFSIIDDINYCIKHFSNTLINLGFEDFWINNKSRIEFYIKFFVAKEWKFVMNKLLFTRFSNYIQKTIPNVSFAELALKDIAEVIKMIEEVQDE